MSDSEFLLAGVLLIAPFVGSFVGVLIVRLPNARSVVFGRSHCDSCDHVLSISDLTPLLSAACLKFRCRYCWKKIDGAHGFAELSAILITAWAALVTGGWILVISCIFGWLLIALAVIDWRHFIIPDVLTTCLMMIGLASTYIFDRSVLLDHLCGVIAGFVILAAVGNLYRLIRGRVGIGLGDAKLLGAIGAWVSLDGVPSVLMLAAMMGLAVATGLALAGRKVNLATKFPFGTFLAAASWLVWLYGPLEFLPA